MPRYTYLSYRLAWLSPDGLIVFNLLINCGKLDTKFYGFWWWNVKIIKIKELIFYYISLFISKIKLQKIKNGIIRKRLQTTLQHFGCGSSKGLIGIVQSIWESGEHFKPRTKTVMGSLRFIYYFSIPLLFKLVKRALQNKNDGIKENTLYFLEYASLACYSVFHTHIVNK